MSLTSQPGGTDLGESVRHMSTTTRYGQQRLDLSRPVPDAVIFDCIDAAEHAPTDGNELALRWLLIRDPKVKETLADICQRTSDRSDARMKDMPVIMIATIWAHEDHSTRPALFDSAIQSAWSFCLALHSRGLAASWANMRSSAVDEIAELLRIPHDVSRIVVLPVAYTSGPNIREEAPTPARRITWIDRWGLTREGRTDHPVTMSDGPGATAEVEIDARSDEVWRLVSDINLPGRFSNEFVEAEWLDEPGEGARFIGKNHNDGIGEWTTTSIVTEWKPGTAFGWSVNDVDDPAARWLFEITPQAGSTLLRFAMILGPGISFLTLFIDQKRDQESNIIATRQSQQRNNMARTLEGIKAIAESAAG